MITKEEQAKEEQAKLDANDYATPGVDLIRQAFREGWELGYKRGSEVPKGLLVDSLDGFAPHGVQLMDLCRVTSRETDKNGVLVRFGLRKEHTSKPVEANTSFSGLLQSQLALSKLQEDMNKRIARLEHENAYKRSGQENHELQQQQPSRLGYVGGFGTIGAAAESSGPFVPTNARGEPVR